MQASRLWEAGRRNAWRLGLVVAILAALWWLGSAVSQHLSLEPAALSRDIRDTGVAGPLVLIGLMVLAVLVGPIPTFPVSATAGLAYGAWLGTLYAVLGATAGAGLAFAIARYGGRKLVARWLTGHVAFCPDCSDRMLFWVVLGARLVPVVSFAVVSYGAGLTAISLPAFLVATVLGMLPMTVVYVAFGASLDLSLAWIAAAGVLVVVAMLAGPRLFERLAPELAARVAARIHGR